MQHEGLSNKIHMLPTIRFGAYEIDSRIVFICRKDKIEQDIPVKSLLLIPDNDPLKVEQDRSLMIPEIFMQ